MTHHSTADCANCGSAFTPAARYCAQCGQSATVHRLNLAHLGHEVIHFFTHADKGIFYLVRMLAVQPGKVVREYIGGRRRMYFSPLNFFLIVAGLFVFVQTTFRPMSAVNLDAAREEVKRIPDPAVQERRLAKLDRVERATNFMARYSNYISMAVTPVVALLYFLCFYRAGYNYTEHLVANLYLNGMNALVYVFVITPYLVLARGSRYYLAGIFAYLAWEAVYRTIGYYQFLHKRGWWRFLYVLIISIAIVMAWSAFSRGMITRYIESGF